MTLKPGKTLSNINISLIYQMLLTGFIYIFLIISANYIIQTADGVSTGG